MIRYRCTLLPWVIQRKCWQCINKPQHWDWDTVTQSGIRIRAWRANLLIEGQSQSESDKLRDRVLRCGRVQNQAHLPAPGGHNTPAALTTGFKIRDWNHRREKSVLENQADATTQHHKAGQATPTICSSPNSIKKHVNLMFLCSCATKV